MTILVTTGIVLIIIFNTLLITRTSSIDNVDIELNFSEETAYIYIKNQTDDIGNRTAELYIDSNLIWEYNLIYSQIRIVYRFKSNLRIY